MDENGNGGEWSSKQEAVKRKSYAEMDERSV